MKVWLLCYTLRKQVTKVICQSIRARMGRKLKVLEQEQIFLELCLFRRYRMKGAKRNLKFKSFTWTFWKLALLLRGEQLVSVISVIRTRVRLKIRLPIWKRGLQSSRGRKRCKNLNIDFTINRSWIRYTGVIGIFIATS